MTAAPIVCSLGGSIVVPSTGIDVAYLKRFRKLILLNVQRGRRFVIVIGGGRTARAYQDAARAIVRLAPEDVDWLGIHATRVNGHLLRALFRDVAMPRVIKDPTRRVIWRAPVLIAAGWKPGWSTDYVAVRLAKKYGATRVVNLTNIDAVYDKDPSRYAGAQPLKHISWIAFRKIVGSTWIPGSNAPFDPIASMCAHRTRLEVVIAHGRNLKNLQAILDGKKFRGTIIRQ